MAASPPNQSLLRVRNESIYYIILIDRTKPDNSVRINPAARHSETIYCFVVLTGDMIFKDLFVGMKLLLRHERLSHAAANSPPKSADLPGFKDKAARRLTRSQTAVVLSPRAILSIPQKVGNVVMDAARRIREKNSSAQLGQASSIE